MRTPYASAPPVLGTAGQPTADGRRTDGAASLDPALVSVCVTTRNRPQLLQQCLASITRQRYRPIEIVVGDNSGDDVTETALRSFEPPDGVPFVYHRHRPPLDYAGNHNWVVERARGARILLIHDDDLLCDGAIERLHRAWTEAPDPAVVYGKLQQIRYSGEPDEAATARFNRIQLQSAAYAGIQASNERAALLQQLPPNGWLMDAALLKKLRFRSPQLIGSYSDIDLGIRLAKAAAGRPFVYVDEVMSRMRQGPGRLSTDRSVDIGAIRFRAVVESFEFEPQARAARDALMQALTNISVIEAARAGQRQRALALMRSPYYTRGWLSLHGLYRLLVIASPALARLANRVFRGL